MTSNRFLLTKLLFAVLLCFIGHWTAATAQEIDFIRTDLNHITMNGDDWSDLRREIKSVSRSRSGKFSVLHIGDSHVQPDIFPGEVRNRLQYVFGNGGRGLLVPLAMAGTNAPADYALSSATSRSARSRLLMRNWRTVMGLTGISVRFASSPVSLDVRTKGLGHDFNRITLLHAQGAGFDTIAVGTDTIAGRASTPWSTDFTLPFMSDSLSLGNIPCSGDFWGVVVGNSRPGVVYHTIGNNGATYAMYHKIDSFAQQTSILHPWLIIISLGTNEAFGSHAYMASQIDRLVTDLRQANPKAKFLLTTPMESQRRGRRGYSVNPSVAVVRGIILDYGREHHIPVWDLYAVAGGEGASRNWLSLQLMNTGDHLHFFQSGYELQGSLLADALIEQLR